MNPRNMMATKAVIKSGQDISRDEPSLCLVYDETETHYIGQWVEGLGYIDVKFPKETTRELTAEEIEIFSKKHYCINSMDLGPYKVCP